MKKQEVKKEVKQEVKPDMKNDFQAWLVKSKGLSELTSIDYKNRVAKVCKLEKTTFEKLYSAISTILPQYEKEGKKAKIGKLGHGGILAGLKKFAEFAGNKPKTPKTNK